MPQHTPQPGTLVDVRARVDNWVGHPINDPERPVVWIDENMDVSAPIEHVQPHWPQEYRDALELLAETVDKEFGACRDELSIQLLPVSLRPIARALAAVNATRPEATA